MGISGADAWIIPRRTLACSFGHPAARRFGAGLEDICSIIPRPVPSGSPTREGQR
jgi:hypothetical protein